MCIPYFHDNEPISDAFINMLPFCHMISERKLDQLEQLERLYTDVWVWYPVQEASLYSPKRRTVLFGRKGTIEALQQSTLSR